jgi:secreted protein with Ig-like and vWFA domain
MGTGSRVVVEDPAPSIWSVVARNPIASSWTTVPPGGSFVVDNATDRLVFERIDQLLVALVTSSVKTPDTRFVAYRLVV